MSEKKIRREGRAVWFGRIQSWQESGQTKSDYCRQHGLSPSNFYNWYRKYRQTAGQSGFELEQQQSHFIPVSIRDEALSSITISYGDVSVSFQGPMQPGQLTTWIKALRAGLC